MLNLIQKALKFIAIGLVAIVALVIIAGIVIPYFLPLDKIKDVAAQKASEVIHRDVKIGKVSFNIFTGIELRNLSISNRPGFSSEPFVSAGLIELKYDFWALLHGKVAIDKVVLIKPEILIEQKADGTSNYGDLVGVKKPATKPAPIKAEKAAQKKEPISIMVSKFEIRNGKLTLKQAGKVNQLKDLNVKVSGITLKTVRPIYIYVSVMGVYEGKSVPISVSGKALLDLGKSYARIYDFDVSAAGEKISLDVAVSGFDKAPNINLKVYSGRLDTDKFLAIVSGTGSKKPKVKAAPAPYGQMTANINKSLKSIPSNLKVNATIELNNILFKEMKLNSVVGKLSLLNKKVNIIIEGIKAYRGTINGNITADLNVSGIAYAVNDLAGKGFDATPASNDILESFLTKLPDYKDLKDKIYGDLGFRISLSGQGVETPDIIANAKGKGSFVLTDGKVSKLKSLSAVGEKLGLKTLQEDIELKEFKANFTFANKVANISNMVLHNGDAGDLKLAFNGSANISTLEFIKGNTLSLKLNPKTTKLSSDYEPFKDEYGWYSLDFEMVGSLKKPIPIPKLGKPIEQIFNNQKKQLENAAQKELDAQRSAAQKEIDAKKKEAEDAAQKEIERQKAAAEEKAKQELEQKAKELLKF